MPIVLQINPYKDLEEISEFDISPEQAAGATQLRNALKELITNAAFGEMHAWLNIPAFDGASLVAFGVIASKTSRALKRNAIQLPVPLDRARIVGGVILMLRDANQQLIDLPMESWSIINQELHKMEEDIVPRKKTKRNSVKAAKKQEPPAPAPLPAACTEILKEDQYL